MTHSQIAEKNNRELRKLILDQRSDMRRLRQEIEQKDETILKLTMKLYSGQNDCKVKVLNLGESK